MFAAFVVFAIRSSENGIKLFLCHLTLNFAITFTN